MIDRRDMLLGFGCVAALGAAEALRPRKMLRLLPQHTKLGTVIPRSFGNWHIGPGGDIVIPQTPGSLSSKLYSDTVTRSYRRDEPSVEDVMLLVAYGEAQSDLLQLHRPEVCYPAVGFQILQRRLVNLPVGPGISVPAVMLSAGAGARIEDVLYWTRLGEDLPQTSGDQRAARLRAAMQGYVGDGVLVRASAIRTDGSDKFAVLRDFAADLIKAVGAVDRAALLGSTVATDIDEERSSQGEPDLSAR